MKGNILEKGIEEGTEIFSITEAEYNDFRVTTDKYSERDRR